MKVSRLPSAKAASNQKVPMNSLLQTPSGQPATATATVTATVSTLCALAFTTALVACGGGSDPAAAPTATPPPPAAASTTLSGAVVKGPVSGAQVCAFAVVGSARGAALGSCTTTDASGNYSFAVPAGSGALWVEATGGSYTDEVTGARVNLPAGSPLVSLATANGAAVTTMLTPLTTLAFNAARTTAGASGTLDATGYAAAAALLLSTFNLPSTLNISTLLPTFGSGINSYGTALTAISQMVANGTTLAGILAATSPSALAAAYATAAAPPAQPPVSGGSATASGSLTVAGATAANAATSLTPRADGFTVALKQDGSTQYHFFSAPLASPSQVDVTVTVSVTGAISAAYFDVPSRTSGFCATNCGITVTPASGATRPVTVAFANAPMGGALRLSGSLVGDATGAAWTLADLAGASSSNLTVGGSSVSVLTSIDSIIDAGGGTLLRSIALRLSDGSTLSLTQTGSAPFAALRVLPPATVSSCSAACNITVADGIGTRVTFANTSLGGGLVVNGTVDFGRTSGSLSTSDSGAFTPVASNIESVNADRTLTFSVLGTAAQAGLSLVTATTRGGRVVQVQATVGIATQVLSCFDNGTVIGVPACTGVTLAADGRTLSFINTVLYGGPLGAAGRNVTFNGTLVAKGP